MESILFISLLYLLNFKSKAGFNPFDFLDFTIFSISLFSGLIAAAKLFRSNLQRPVAMYFMSLFVLYGGLVIYTLASLQGVSAWATFIQHVIFIPLIYFFFLLNFDERSEKTLLQFLILSGITIIIIGFIRQNINIFYYTGILKANRFSGLLGNPNINASVILYTWLFSISYIFNFTRKYRYVQFHLLTMFATPFIIITWSRRVFLVFVISYLFVSLYKSKYIIKLLGVISIVILIIFLTSNFQLDIRSTSTTDRVNELLDFRDALSSTSVFTGLGPGKIGVASQFTSDQTYYRVHSYYTQLVADYGIVVGILITVALSAPILLPNGLNLHPSKTAIGYKIGIIGSMLLGLAGLTNVTFPLNLFHVIMLALVLCHYHRSHYPVNRLSI